MYVYVYYIYIYIYIYIEHTQYTLVHASRMILVVKKPTVEIEAGRYRQSRRDQHKTHQET